MRTASREGGFLVLVGNSSVGKTRLLYECARAELRDFAVLAPDLGDGGLVNTVADATFRLPKLIVWLDELQRFLPGPYFVAGDQPSNVPISPAAVRRLLTADTPVIIVGTLWPQYASALGAQKPDAATGEPRYLYQDAADILLVSDVVKRISIGSFSPAERTRTALLAASDGRLARAVADPDYNVTEALAGAPQIMRRYEQASQAEQAIVHAAVDARRLGVQATLTEEFLRDAARGYLTTVHPDDTWFTNALLELTSSTRPHDRATSPLIPKPAPDRRSVQGYVPTDYLLQHLARQRRSHQLSRHTWRALTNHARHFGHDDELRLAESARSRMMNRTAERLYEDLIYIHFEAYGALAALRAQRGDVAGATRALRERVDDGDVFAAVQLATLQVEQGDTEEAINTLRPHAEGLSEPIAVDFLAVLLAQHRSISEAITFLREDAEEQERINLRLLAAILGEGDSTLPGLRHASDPSDREDPVCEGSQRSATDREGQFTLPFRAGSSPGDYDAAARLARQLAQRDDVPLAIDVARRRGNPDDPSLAIWTAERLSELGQPEDAIALLRPHADAGNPAAADKLAELSAQDRDTTDLQGSPGDGPTTDEEQQTTAAVDPRVIDALRSAADGGSYAAAKQLIQLLTRQNARDLLFAEVYAGTYGAADALITYLTQHGEAEEAQRLRLHGLDDGNTA
ncbi:tetratricopeptide repeat protein [Streptomyces sp. NPDC002547]